MPFVTPTLLDRGRMAVPVGSSVGRELDVIARLLLKLVLRGTAVAVVTSPLLERDRSVGSELDVITAIIVEGVVNGIAILFVPIWLVETSVIEARAIDVVVLSGMTSCTELVEPSGRTEESIWSKDEVLGAWVDVITATGSWIGRLEVSEMGTSNRIELEELEEKVEIGIADGVYNEVPTACIYVDTVVGF